MTISNILSLLFGSGLLVSIFGYIIRKMKKQEQKTKSVCLGVQALLRDRLYDRYNECIEKGYASIQTKENFENMYNQYHNLGANGVMDGIHEEMLALPTSKGN